MLCASFSAFHQLVLHDLHLLHLRNDNCITPFCIETNIYLVLRTPVLAVHFVALFLRFISIINKGASEPQTSRRDLVRGT
jgi:hypothetical protein